MPPIGNDSSPVGSSITIDGEVYTIEPYTLSAVTMRAISRGLNRVSLEKLLTLQRETEAADPLVRRELYLIYERAVREYATWQPTPWEHIHSLLMEPEVCVEIMAICCTEIKNSATPGHEARRICNLVPNHNDLVRAIKESAGAEQIKN